MKREGRWIEDDSFYLGLNFGRLQQAAKSEVLRGEGGGKVGVDFARIDGDERLQPCAGGGDGAEVESDGIQEST